MRFSPFRAFPPIQSRYTQLSISPPSVPFFPRRRIGEPYSIRRAAPLFGLAGRDAPVFLPAFPSRLAGRRGHRSPLSAFLSVQSASRLPPRFAFRQTARGLPDYPLSYTSGGEDVCFFSRTYSFSSSISTRHVIHFSIYMRAWWNGRHARFRFWWRNPCGFESHRPHHGKCTARLRSPFR